MKRRIAVAVFNWTLAGALGLFMGIPMAGQTPGEAVSSSEDAAAEVLVAEGVEPTEPDRAADVAETPGAALENGGDGPSSEVETASEKALPPAGPKKPRAKKQGGGKWQVYVLPIQDTISKPTLFILKRALKQAIEDNIDAVVLDMNTPGGRVDVTLEIMEMLDRFEGQSITYVNTDAISAGSLIASSTDEIFFAPKSQIGAAAVVFATGQDVPETARQKLESYMRAKVRNYAETDPYRAKVIRAMMEAEYILEIEGEELKPGGELLTLTGTEAMKLYGSPPRPLLGAGIAESIDDLLAMKFAEGGFEVVAFEITWSESLAQYMEMIAPVIMGLGLLLLFVEFKTPGFGVFGILGISLLAVAFASNYVIGLAGNEAFLFLVLGIILIGVEIFVFPGTLIFAVTGICLIFGSLIWSLADIWPVSPGSPKAVDFSPLWPAFEEAVIAMVVAMVGAAVLWRFLPQTRFYNQMVLEGTSAEADPVTSGGGSRLSGSTKLPDIGAKGVVAKELHPTGVVEIDGERYEASVQIGTLSRGDAVKVVGYRNFYLLVAEDREA